MSNFEKQQRRMLRQTKREINRILRVNNIEPSQRRCVPFAHRFYTFYSNDSSYRYAARQLLKQLHHEPLLPIAASSADEYHQNNYCACILLCLLQNEFKGTVFETKNFETIPLTKTNDFYIEQQLTIFGKALELLRQNQDEALPIKRDVTDMLLKRIEKLERRLDEIEAKH